MEMDLLYNFIQYFKLPYEYFTILGLICVQPFMDLLIHFILYDCFLFAALFQR